MEGFDKNSIADQNSLNKWVMEADFERDVQGKFRSANHSIGYTLFKWLQLRIGIDTIKPDVHIINFVTHCIGRSITPEEAVSALIRVAQETNRKAFRLDAAIWNYQRNNKSSMVKPRRNQKREAGESDWRNKTTAYHDALDTLFANYRGQMMKTSEIRDIIKADQRLAPNAQFIYPSDHCLNHTNRGACHCALTMRAIFERVRQGLYCVRKHEDLKK